MAGFVGSGPVRHPVKAWSAFGRRSAPMYRLSLVRKPGRALSAIMSGSCNLLFNPFSKFLRCDGLAGQCYGVFSPWGIPAGASLALARVRASLRAASPLLARALSKSLHPASLIATRWLLEQRRKLEVQHHA